MTGKADRRRPLGVAILLIAAIGAALVAPVLIGGRKGEPIPGSMVRASTRDSVAITQPLTLFTQPAVTLEQGSVSLADPNSGESRVGAVLRALVLGGGVDLVLDGARIVVDRTGNPVTPAAAPASGQPLAEPLPEPLAPLVSALAGFKFRNLTLLDSTFVIKTAQGGTQTIPRINAEVEVDRHGVVNAKGQFEYRGEPLDFDVTFTLPPSKADVPIHVQAKLKGKFLETSFSGRIAPGDRGQITAQNAEFSVTDLHSAARWLGTSWPSGTGLRTLSAKGLLTLDERSVSFENAQFTLDGNAATGALAATMTPERPSIEGTLAFPTFDLAPYATPDRPYAIALATDWLADFRLPGLGSPSLLRDIDADIRISAASVMSGPDRLGRCAASLSVKDGMLYGEIAELELDQGGTGEGQFTVDMSSDAPRYSVRAHLNDIDLNKFAAARLGPAVIDGSGDIAFDVTAHGATQSDVLQSVSGTMALDMTEGGRLGFDLDALPAAAASAPAAGWGPAATGTTTVETLSARFKVANGILTTEAVQAKADDRTVTLTGTVDIDKSAMDLLLSIARAPGTGEANPAKAAGSFKMQGPWSAPAISPAGPEKSAHDTVPGANPG